MTGFLTFAPAALTVAGVAAAFLKQPKPHAAYAPKRFKRYES